MCIRAMCDVHIFRELVDCISVLVNHKTINLYPANLHSFKTSNKLQLIYRGYPAKMALPAMFTHGR